MSKIYFFLIFLIFLIGCSNSLNVDKSEGNIQQSPEKLKEVSLPVGTVSERQLVEDYYNDDSFVNVSNIHKEYIIPKIRNNNSYCGEGKPNGTCICLTGYFKLDSDGRYDCIPNICYFVRGWTPVSDDLFDLNIKFCEWAVRDKRADVCSNVGYELGKDICLLAYVGVTNDTSTCSNINDAHLHNECYK